MAKTINLNISVPFKNMKEWEKIDKEVPKLVGRSETGAGTGFGMRDMDFCFKSKQAAENAIKRVRAVYPKIETAIFEYDE